MWKAADGSALTGWVLGALTYLALEVWPQTPSGPAPPGRTLIQWAAIALWFACGCYLAQRIAPARQRASKPAECRPEPAGAEAIEEQEVEAGVLADEPSWAS